VPTQHNGIEQRHARSCRTTKGGNCNCTPSYRASVMVNGKREKRTFSELAEAISWRKDAKIALRRGANVPGRNLTTLREAAAEWQRLVGAGVIRSRSGERFKPATLRAYDSGLRRVLDTYGDEPLADLSRAAWQGLVDDLLADGLGPSTVRVTLAAVAAIYRHEVSRGRLPTNPVADLHLPAANGRRERFASPEEAAALLAALPAAERPVWATAMFTGMRCGELQALRARDVRLADGVIDVHHGWDPCEGRQETKARNRRRVPIPAALREVLAAELLRTGRRGDDLVFGATATLPFVPKTVQRRADAAWKRAGLTRLTFHDCRHTYASLMIAAGANAKALSSYLGHASIEITFDRYGHLMPGNEAEAAGLMDAYLAKSVV
jgi:integrase